MTRIMAGAPSDIGKPVVGIEYSVEPGNWVTANQPIKGEKSWLLERQPEVFTLTKVVPGPGLRIEIPFSGSKRRPDFWVLEKMMSEASGRIQGLIPKEIDATSAPEHIHNVLTEFRNSSPWEISDSITGLTLVFRKGQFEKEIQIESHQKGVRVWITLFKLGKPEPVSLKALTHFCLALNERLRMARASLLSDTVVLEVLIEKGILDPWRLEKAVGALLVGAEYAKREARILKEPKVAQAYCAFHHKLI